jgi:predicted acetyltransferase
VDEAGEEPVPTYRFRIVQAPSGIAVGFINLRVGSSPNLLLYRGHIGYGVDAPYRGNGYAASACALLLPLAHLHRIDPLWITCNPDNHASRRTCEKLGAELVEIIEVPQNTEAYRAGARIKCRYMLSTNPT